MAYLVGNCGIDRRGGQGADGGRPGGGTGIAMTRPFATLDSFPLPPPLHHLGTLESRYRKPGNGRQEGAL
jgi:hypothetical protein